MPDFSLAKIADSGASSRDDAGCANASARSEKPTREAARRPL